MATKQCKHCRSEIDEKSSKCPHCQTDLRNLFQKHPTLTGILVLFVILTFLGSLFSDSDKSNNKALEINKKSPSLIRQKAINKELEQKMSLLRADMRENINKTVGNIFTDSYIEQVSDNYFKLTLTVKDDWYYLKEFQQERLLEVAWQYFNSLGSKYGLRQEKDLAWEVIFIDTYKKELLKKGW